MDSKDVEAEIHPLKNEDGKLQENLGNRLKKEDNLKSAPLQSRLSRCRTVAFFLSLFICLLVVFVISFIIPCPDRPVSQGMWRINYNTAVTYDFLATEDINRDRIQDVLFLYKTTDGSNNFNQSCADEGFSSPCSFMAAASGANGSILWERPVAQDGALVLCGVPQPRDSGASSACILVGRPGSLIAVDLFTGSTLWNHSTSFRRNASILSPLLQVPDLDADGTPDLLVLTQEDKEVNSYIYSGKTGHQIGHRGSLGVDGTSGFLLYVTRAGAHYILLPCASSLCGRSVKGIYEKPDTLAVVIENGTSIDRQILLLDLSTGVVLWDQALPALPGYPQSASLPTADHRSAFFFWGLHELAGANQTEPRDTQHSLYMFHPTLPGVLLELANVSANIIAFQVALFEPSRHAACILLTGPASPDAPGLVSLAKHKVQDLVLSSRVVHLTEGGSDSDQAIRDRLSHLRYQSEA
uniref:FAM234A/B beta-propeller domain-containing protein n=1 Tax=Molossus molossus TaxID=27622 RepID=A0A7J8IYU1_MOLMO|nr:hypothetical protein HJG59_004902 [Molossus molossus]